MQDSPAPPTADVSLGGVQAELPNASTDAPAIDGDIAFKAPDAALPTADDVAAPSAGALSPVPNLPEGSAHLPDGLQSGPSLGHSLSGTTRGGVDDMMPDDMVALPPHTGKEPPLAVIAESGASLPDDTLSLSPRTGEELPQERAP